MTAATKEISFRLAGPEDDAEIRRLLRDNAMSGGISLSLEREPSYFAAAALEGEPHQAMLAREPSGRAVGLFSRSEREAYANGAVRRVGYLGQLRLDREYRGRLALLRAGFEACRELHASGSAPWYVTSIVEDNAPARRVLTAGMRGLPAYVERGRMITFALAVPRRTRWPSAVARARAAQVEDVARLLDEDRRRFQLAPHVSADALYSARRSPGLSPEDFLLVERAGALAGCVAIWDQRGFKQTVVRGYGGWLRTARPLWNAAARALGRPGLPDVGAALPHAFLAHFAVRGDDPAVADGLLDASLAAARERGIDFLSLGLCAAHPLARLVRRRHPREYASLIYVVHWEDGAAQAAQLDARPVNVEVATL